MAESTPRRRKTDTWNGKLKALAVGFGWTVTLAGWAYSVGVHTARDEIQERDIRANHGAIQLIQQVDMDLARNVAVLLESTRQLDQRVKELREQLQEHDRRAGLR